MRQFGVVGLDGVSLEAASAISVAPHLRSSAALLFRSLSAWQCPAGPPRPRSSLPFPAPGLEGGHNQLRGLHKDYDEPEDLHDEGGHVRALYDNHFGKGGLGPQPVGRSSQIILVFSWFF